MKPRAWMVLGLVAAAYAAVARAGFVWDDHFLFEGNYALRDFHLAEVLREDLWCCTGTAGSPYYRPLTTLSFAVDYALGDGRPLLPHLQSLAWHLVVTALTMRWLRPKLGDHALLAGLIVGLHPLSSEAVVWIAARNDLLAAAFTLATLVVLDGAGGRSAETPSAAQARNVLVFALSMEACLAKESAALLPILAWLGRRIRGGQAGDGGTGDRGTWGLTFGETLALLLGPAAAGLMRLQVHWSVLSDGAGGHAAGILPKVQAAAQLLGWIVWPWPLTSTAIVGPPAPATWLAAAVAVAGMAWAARRGAGGWLLWAAVAFVPAAYGVDQYGILGERYLYLPMIGVAAAVATVARSSPGLTRFVAVPWTLAALVALHVRLPDWADDVAFFGAADARVPTSAARSLHASALRDAGDKDGALRLYAEALAMQPSSAFACQKVVEVAAPHAGEPIVRQRLVEWAHIGCRRTPPYYDSAVFVLWRAGDVDAVRTLLAEGGRGDPRGGAERVEAALRWEDGDLLGAAALAGGYDLAGFRDAIDWLLRSRGDLSQPVESPSGPIGELAPVPAPL